MARNLHMWQWSLAADDFSSAARHGAKLATRSGSEESVMLPLLPQTATEAYALGYADGYRGELPLRELYTWETQDAYAAGYRAGWRRR
jgi:hypothetical protein